MNEYLPKIIASAVILVLIPVLKAAIKKVISRYGTTSQKSEARVKQIKQIIGITFNVLLIISLAMTWGVRPENLLGGLTAIAAVIGVAFFAQWSILSNITAGIVIFFGAPYRVGDHIRIIDKDTPIIATIESIGAFYTHIRSDDNELIVLPNNLFLQKIISISNIDSDEDNAS